MARQYRYTLIRRLGNALMEPAVKLGLAPGRTWLLSVTGRRSGKRYTTPVNLVERDGVRYLVSPYGERAWVKNARAAGEVTLRRGRTVMTPHIEELPPEAAAPVVADYWRQNIITRPFFDARPDGSEAAFVEEARRHPVFRLAEP